ncbi:ShlB/FhaC/HecB family hemolysin secretion/activation protein [Defluviicoccus vanus]
MAQRASPDIPPAALPDVRLQRLPTEEAPSPAPQLSVPPPAPAYPSPSAGAVRFRLQRVDLFGVTAYPVTELQATFDPLIDTEVTLADIYRLAKNIERRYRDDGYFLSRAIVPVQTVEDGRVRLQVLEGFVAAVRIEGDVGAVQSLLQAYIDPVTRERPLRFATLERALLLANDLPGLSVSGLLQPAPSQPGAADLVVSASRQPFEASMLVDNLGDDYTGRYEYAASVSSNAWTPLGERVSAVGFVTNPFDDHNQKVGQFSTSWRLGGDGLALETIYSYGVSHPGSTVAPLDIESNTWLAGASAVYPVIRSRSFNLSGRFGFEALNDNVDFFGNTTLSRDRLRVLLMTANIDFRDAWRGTNTFETTLRQGLPVLDATRRSDDDKSRSDGTGQATVFQASLSRLQPVYDNLAVYVASSGQYAFTSVLSDQEFLLGGAQFGRGYDYATLAGDSGIGGTAELRYTQPLPWAEFDRVQVFGFVDGGRVWDRQTLGEDQLTSTGGGLRLFPFDRLFFELVGAKPLTLDSGRANGDRDPQFLFRAVGRL